MRQVKFSGFSLILCCCVLFLCGCQRAIIERVPISGIVTVDGEKLQRGVISFVSVSNPDVVEGCEIIDGVFECQVLVGDKFVHCSGSKIVGSYAPDPFFPDKVEPELEELPEESFEQEIRINVSRRGNYFRIRYGEESEDSRKKPINLELLNMTD